MRSARPTTGRAGVGVVSVADVLSTAAVAAAVAATARQSSHSAGDGLEALADLVSTAFGPRSRAADELEAVTSEHADPTRHAGVLAALLTQRAYEDPPFAAELRDWLGGHQHSSF